jgi:GNAT superfamily N-acetyltransferase
MLHVSSKGLLSTTAQSAPSPPNRTQRSAPARLRCQWEPFSAIVDELWPLLKRQNAEIGVHTDAIPLDPAWDTYFSYERAGLLRIWTARHGDTLVGFVNCFLTTSLLCQSVLHGYAEHFYLAPEWRSGWTGRNMLRSCRKAMEALGAKVTRFHTNDTYEPDAHGRSRVGGLLRADGYEPIVTIWERVS